MRVRLYFFIFLSLVNLPIHAQEIPGGHEERIYTVSEVSRKPAPLAGLGGFQKKWSNKVIYPEDAVKSKVQGLVFIEFIVEKDGSIGHAAVRSGLGYGCDEAALEGFIKISKDPWLPAIRNGEPVRVKMVLPFQFKIIKM